MVETLKVIGEKGVRITPDVMASGGTGDGGGNLGTLLLFNLFRDKLGINGDGAKAGENGAKKPVIG